MTQVAFKIEKRNASNIKAQYPFPTVLALSRAMVVEILKGESKCTYMNGYSSLLHRYNIYSEPQHVADLKGQKDDNIIRKWKE